MLLTFRALRRIAASAWVLAAPVLLWAQQPAAPSLTLQQAENEALQNSPTLAAYQLKGRAAVEVTAEQRSAFFPTLAGNATAVGADHGSVLDAGNLTTSTLAGRIAAGLGLAQLVTDFGRTGDLVRAARLSAESTGASAEDVREQVILAVRQAYYQAMAASAVRRAVAAALANRQLSLRQIQALAASNLRSTLDVQFAQVLVSDAQLADTQAENTLTESWANLADAMGLPGAAVYALAQVPLPSPLPPDPSPLIAVALRSRPDLEALELSEQSQVQKAEADGKLSLPALDLLAATGESPDHDYTVHRDTYAAAGVNLNLPILNGGLFAARHAESELQALAGEKEVEQLRLHIDRDVRDAYLEADTAFRDLAVTDQLVQESNRALELAQVRYDNGLGSIVELNEAQLAQTSAQIQEASARATYLSRRAALDYAMGIH